MDTPNNTQKKLTLLVLAAGIGSRYGGIKQIDGFGPNGETIMDYSLFDAVTGRIYQSCVYRTGRDLGNSKRKIPAKIERQGGS